MLPLCKRLHLIGEFLVVVESRAVSMWGLRPRRRYNRCIDNGKPVEGRPPPHNVNRIDLLHVPVEFLVRHDSKQPIGCRCRAVGHARGSSSALGGTQS